MAGSGVDWCITVDGSISIHEPTASITYHPTLNVILVLTKEPAVIILDVNSGTLLQKSTLSALSNSSVKCTYIPNQDKILMTDGRTVGLRKDHGGVLLLDTILQSSINLTDDKVKIELLLSEAVQLLKCLQATEIPGIDNISEFSKYLEEEISRCHITTKNNPKSLKWSTVCLEFSHAYLKTVSSGVVQELKRLNKHLPALAVASAISERLNMLLPESRNDAPPSATQTVDRSLMYSEAARRETFSKWPHMNYKWALPDQMAQAGFYHQPNSTGDDRAMCFTCNVCLVCWEPTDEPWSEHERHSPSCPFVKGEYTQNVPLAVTYATNPAVVMGTDNAEEFHIASSLSSEISATFNASGNVIIWDTSRNLKKDLDFRIGNNEPFTKEFKCQPKSSSEGICDAKSKTDCDGGSIPFSNQQCTSSNESWSERSSKLVLSSLCILEMGKNLNDEEGTANLKPCIIAGVSLKRDFKRVSEAGTPIQTTNADELPLVQVMNDVNNASSREMPLDIMHVDDDASQSSVPYLLLYDITRQPPGNVLTKRTEILSSTPKKTSSSSGTQQESNAMYGNFGVVLCDMLHDPSCTLNIVDVGPLDGFSNSSDIKFGGPLSSSDLTNSEVGSISSSSTILEQHPVVVNELREKFQSVGLLTQCVELPKCFQQESFHVKSLHPTADGKYILACVEMKTNSSCDSQLCNIENMNTPSMKSSSSGKNKMTDADDCCGGLLLYSLCSNNLCIMLDDKPSVVQTTGTHMDNAKLLLMLSLEVTDAASVSSLDSNGPTGYFVTVTYGNHLRLHSLNTLEVEAEYLLTTNEEIVSMTYCTSIEKLCLCTNNGKLLFFNLTQTQSSLTEDAIMESMSQADFIREEAASEPCGSAKDFTENEGAMDLLIHQPLTSETLFALHELSQFENLTPRFTANMPPCWTEIQQEQKQRRHPQHLQQQGEALQHTRSWRLQNDSHTWDEHLIEIILPKSCCVGHIDFKFNFHPICLTPPNIQITLLKQIASNIGKTKQNYFHNDNVDDSIDFNTFATQEQSEFGGSSSSNNPVTSKSFLELHNAEIMCGPLDLTSCLDLSGQSGVATLTSSELLKFSSRSLLIHLKALPSEKESNNKQEVFSSRPTPVMSKSSLHQYVVKIKDKKGGVPSLQSMLEFFAPPGSAVERLAATAPNKKISNLKGCDWLHEISITVMKTKHTKIPRERVQRAAMLGSVTFHEKLINLICGNDYNSSMPLECHQHLAIDILIWITSIQMYKKNPSPQEVLALWPIEENIGNLIKSCFVDGTRSVAHKCCKLIVICLEHAKIMQNQVVTSVFDFALLHGLMEWLPMITKCRSAGALRWLFLLLNRVKYLEATFVAKKCVELLVTISKQYHERNNPLHSLLRSRFGLNGIPFEPELFDIEPSPCLKPTSTPVSYASVVSNANQTSINAHSNSAFAVGDDIDLRDLLTLNSNDRSGCRGFYTFPGQHLRGLLEVEPLYFTCHAASDGTKMEKIENSSHVGTVPTSNIPGTMFEPVPPCLHASNSFSNWTGSLSSLFSTLKKKQEEFLKLQQHHKKLEQTLADSVLPPQIDAIHVKRPSKFCPKTSTGSGTIMVSSSSSSSSSNSAFSYHGLKYPEMLLLSGTGQIEKTFTGIGENEKFKNQEKSPVETKKQETIPNIGPSLWMSPWQQLAQPPPQQVLVIERMHSGARRFVVLDFGKPILLTDLIIPACLDLVSLSIDIWKQAEEIDGQRLVVTTDIGVRSLVMSDLQPPPVCRFLKITTIGRYGMGTTRCRIPIGMFYGHTFILPWEIQMQAKGSHLDVVHSEDLESQIQPQLNTLSSLLEDIHCRYSLACDKLFNFLMPLLPTEHHSSQQAHFFGQRDKDKLSESDKRIITAYQECQQLQLQLNLITHAMARLERTQAWLENSAKDPAMQNADGLRLMQQDPLMCTDKLRTIIECLSDVLLGLTYPTLSSPSLSPSVYKVFNQEICETLLQYLCVHGSHRMQLSCSTLLVRMCGMQPWWGKFVAKMLVLLYSSEQSLLFPQDKIFILLTYLGQKSLASNSGSSVLESIVALLEQLLNPLTNRETGFVRGILDLPLIGWVLLFLSVCLDNMAVNSHVGTDDSENSGNKVETNSREREQGAVSNRWDFIQGEVAMLRTRSSNLKNPRSRLYRRKLQKRLMHHKQQLDDLEQAKKAFLTSTQAMSALHSQFGNKTSASIKDLENAVKHREQLFKKTLKQHTAKHFKDIIQIRRNDALIKKATSTSRNLMGYPEVEKDEGANEKEVLPPLSRSKSLPVVKGLTALLLAMDFTCNVDMFLLACKVLARIATSTRPAISLGEAFTLDQLRLIMQLCVGTENQAGCSPWGGPWASHAITCLLQDLLEGERLFPCSMSHEASPAEEDLVSFASETDDSLQDNCSSSSFSPYADETDSIAQGMQADLGIIDSEDSESDDCNMDIFESNNLPKKFPFGTSHKKSWTGIYNVLKSARVASKEGKSPDVIGNSNSTAAHTVSTAVDARLEYGLEMNAELRLKVLTTIEADLLCNTIMAPLPALPDDAVQESEDEMNDGASAGLGGSVNNDMSNSETIPSVEMLSFCFNQTFSQLPVVHVNLEALLHLWLTLNEDASSDSGNSVSFEPSMVPAVPLNSTAVSGLLAALSWYPRITLQTWCLAFQTLTILSNLKVSHNDSGLHDAAGSSRFANSFHSHMHAAADNVQDDINTSWLAYSIVSDQNLLSVLVKFLSGTRLHVSGGTINNNVGPTVCRALHNFLVRLQLRCDVVSPDSRLNVHLKDLLLKLVHSLIMNSDTVHCNQGPLDAQCKFFEMLLHIQFDCLDSNIAMNVIIATVNLVHNYIANSDKVLCKSSVETSVNAASCFGGLFASVRGENQSSINSSVNRDMLICNLLKLLNTLVQIPVSKPQARSSASAVRLNSTPSSFSFNISHPNKALEPLTDSTKLEQQSHLGIFDLQESVQTDEHKTAAATSSSQISQHCCHTNSNVDDANRTIYITDLVLSHEPTMLRLFSALANCMGSTMAMLLGVNGLNSGVSDPNERFVLGEPISVGDNVFQLLCTLNMKASNIKLILQALHAYICNGLSEPSHYSGLPIVPRLSEPLLWFMLRALDCETALKEFLSMGGIHVLCKNLVHSNRQLINSHPSFVSTIMQYMNSARSNHLSKHQNSDLETVAGLLNFAPLGTIASSNPMAQPAEVLIQAAPPHRRARTPAWSYHFYPDESWVDLTITLPCAILLKEIQIQPHLTSLATCPSAVSVEICRDSCSSNSPLCPPQMTNGLTFIRLQLTQPEIATSVTIRLHKPRDSSNIGLSQILLLGSTTFGEAIVKSQMSSVPSEDNVSRSSLGWLRIIHHCLTLPVDSTVQKQVCEAAVSIQQFLQACCTLLLTPNLGVYMAHTEQVLLQLGLYSTEVGLTEIYTLLRNTGWTHAQDALQVPLNTSALDSIVEIIFQLCTTIDAGTKTRVEAVLAWLKESAATALVEHEYASAEASRKNSSQRKIATSPPIAYIHCVAAILWRHSDILANIDLSSLIDQLLIRSLLEWSMILGAKSAMKKAIDQVLCAICHIQPHYFVSLLGWMDVLVTTRMSPQTNIAEMDSGSGDLPNPLTDDSKEAGVDQFRTKKFLRVDLNESQLVTLGTVCQSPSAVQHLLQSGFPCALVHKILHFCTTNSTDGASVRNEESTSSSSLPFTMNRNNFFTNLLKCKVNERSDLTGGCSDVCDSSAIWGSVSRVDTSLTDADKVNNSHVDDQVHITGCNELATPEFVAAALDFFTDLCDESVMRDWLGGPEGSLFWLPLLDFLCNSDSHYIPQSILNKDLKKRSKLNNQQRSLLEMATLRFLSHCCWTYSPNQHLLAQVLCDVIRQQGNQQPGSGMIHVISGFTRRLILQLLLENEKLLVFIRSQHPLPQCSLGIPSSLPQHPRFGCGHNFRLLYVNIQMTCSDIIKNVSDSGILCMQPMEMKEDKDMNKKDMAELGLDRLSITAGVMAKDKRQRDSKSNSADRASTAKGSGSADYSTTNALVLPTYALMHSALPNQTLPSKMTLAQLLSLIRLQNSGSNIATISLNLIQTRKSRDLAELQESIYELPDSLLSQCDPLPTTLQVFAAMGGLALLAQHLPLLYPEITRLSNQPTHSSSADRNCTEMGGLLDSDWVKVESTDDINDDFLELIPAGTSSPQSKQSNQLPPLSIPPHSLAAFGLFLRLPGYAEVLLKEWKKAQCLLRLALGITDNGEGGDIFQSSVATSLPTLPFQVLQQLFDSTPLTTDDGMLLRRMALEIGAIHLLLACLAVLSHQSGDINLPGFQHEIFLAAAKASKSPAECGGKSDDKSHLYWAKGTGFGTGSTDQSWDVEQAILRQRSEEEHVTCLLQVLSSYINPGGNLPKYMESDCCDDDTPLTQLPPVFPELLSQSCLIPAMSSYLRNDSVLDMARHVPLYRALLQLLRALAVSSQLMKLLLPSDTADISMSIGSLLNKMKSCVDVYASKLKPNKGKSNGKTAGKSSVKTKEDEENEGLAQLIPDIQQTTRIVQSAIDRMLLEKVDENSGQEAYLPKISPSTLEERYMDVMSKLQFDTFEMIVEDDEAIRFTISHHFESNLRAAGEHSHPSRSRRLAQEAVTLSTSLPLSYSSSVFVRCDQDRLDLMKVLITGPAETPYANGCFEFDVYFPPDYPHSPMMINLETTGHHTVRFNPNLYNDGKVCLSVLNTWHGRPEEKWNPQTSSFLQVLVSIQSLILVQEPYFNEPGYERSRGTPSGTQSSREYDSNIRLATVKWGMLEQLRNPCPCFKEIIHKHFWVKRSEIVKQIETWITEMDSHSSDRRIGRTIALNSVALKHHLSQLKEEFLKMKAPTGLEDLSSSFDVSRSQFSSLSATAESPEAPVMAEESAQDSSDLNDTNVEPV